MIAIVVCNTVEGCCTELDKCWFEVSNRFCMFSQSKASKLVLWSVAAAMAAVAISHRDGGTVVVQGPHGGTSVLQALSGESFCLEAEGFAAIGFDLHGWGYLEPKASGPK
eukprot:10347522-Lingulodinium_polyedra.AAC.1